jgi:HK97 family phage portal protein
MGLLDIFAPRSTVEEPDASDYGPLREVVTVPRNSTGTTLTNPDPWLVETLISRASASGVRVNPLTALGVPTVFACVNAISRSISSIPIQLYRRRPDGGRDLAVDHPLYTLLHDAPNEDMTSADFRRAVQANATLRNSGYALIIRDGMGTVVELQPIANHDIYPFYATEDAPLQYMLKGVPVAKERILHIRGLTLNGISGLDAVLMTKDAIGLAIALQDHASRYFPNASSPSLFLTTPGNLSKDQLELIREELLARSAGGANAHRPMVLSNGTTASAVSAPDNQKGQFLEAKIYQDKCICQSFGVPQIKAGITDAAHYNNVEQENQNYITDTLMPWAVQWEQAMNQRLLTQRERGRYFFKFQLSGLLRADAVSRATYYEKMLQNGIFTRNEVRQLEDRNAVEGGDNFVISQNVQLLDSTGAPMPKPAQAQPATQ